MKNSTIGTYGAIAAGAAMLVLVICWRSAAVEAVYPMERAVGFFRGSVWSRVKGVFNGPVFAAENRRLRREIATLSMLTGEVERLSRENAALRRSLEYAAREPERWLAAPVLSAHGGAFGVRRTLRLGRGSVDGVVEGAIVSAPEGLVGQVSAVTPHTSEVVLLTDPSVKVACSIELAGQRFASGILEGGDGRLALAHIRGLSQDAPKARVVTSGRGGVFPKGLEIGTLLTARGSESGEWRGEIEPAVDFEALEDVFVSRER